MTNIVLAATLFYSTLILCFLAFSDPKRQRTAGHNKHLYKHKGNLRKLLAGSLALPVILFLFLGHWPLLLMYLGASLTIGWVVTILLGLQSADPT